MMLTPKDPALFVRFLVLAVAFIGSMAVSRSATAQVVIQPPLANMQVTSHFGYRNIPNGSTFHKGVDLRAQSPTPAIVTPGYTSINYLPNRGHAGNMLVVQYSCNVEVRYFHLSSFTEPAMPITGSSGTEAPHLHFEIHVGGSPVDPMAAIGINLCDAQTVTCLKDHAGFAMTPPASAGQPENRGTRQDECGANPATTFPGDAPLIAPSGLPTDEENEDSAYPRPVTDGPQRPPAEQQHFPPPTIINGVESRATNPEPGGAVIYDLLPSGMTTAACDVDVFTLLRARGAFEAQEDVIYSEMAIHKPDSVLEYSCFNQFMNHTATPGAAIFSETDSFSGPGGGLLGAILGSVGVGVRPVLYRFGRIHIPMFTNTRLSPASMDIVLGQTVMSTMGHYLNNQFPHNLGGGTTDITNSIVGLIGNQGYNCDIMQRVWVASKCQNFSDTTYMDAAKGPFFQYEEMVAQTGNSNDPRTQRQECIDTGMYEEDILKLQNAGFAYNGMEPAFYNSAVTSPEDFGSILGGLFGGLFGGGEGTAPEDGITLFDMTDPEQCNILPPIGTGVINLIVENPGEATENVIQFEGHTCSNIGCHYDYEADECTR